jgi:PAS domain S-box-containing protein
MQPADDRYILEVLMEYAPDRIYFKDAQSRFVRINRAQAAWLGAPTPAAAVGKTDYDFFSEEHARQAFDDEQEIMRTGVPIINKEEKETWPDGRVTWVSSMKMPLRDAEGRVIGTFGISRDITERRVAEEQFREALRQTQQTEIRFQQLLESAPDGILIVDDRGRIQMANRQMETLFGYRQDELLNQSVEMLVPERLRPAHAQHRSDYNAAPHTRPMGTGLDLRGRRKDGSEFPIEISLSPLSLQDRPMTVAIVRDVTERKRAEEILRTQAAELARSNADLEQYAMVASHDLQEPLRMVAIYCERIRQAYQGKLDPQADTYIGYAVEGARRMQRLINAVLEHAEIGAHLRPRTSVNCDVALQRALIALHDAIIASGAEINADPLPTVTGDLTELVTIFHHLLDNAIKFHGEQPPRIRLSAEMRDGQWEFRVCDNGIGFDPKYANRIFIMFQRLHARHRYPGDGIGLALCKKIVEHHGGKIWGESVPGQGSTFHFTLPTADQQP